MFSRNAPSPPADGVGDVFAPVADLMVAVVFVILLLVLTLSLQLDPKGAVPRGEHNRVVAELAAARAQLAGHEAELARLSAVVRFVRDGRIVPAMDRMAHADQVRSEILGELRQRLREAGVDVAVDTKAGTLALPASSLFASGRSEPSAEGRDTILKLGRVLTEVLPCYAAAADADCPDGGSAGSIGAVYIEGHTDVQPFSQVGGRFRNNWDLSAGRAIEAFTLLRGSFDKLRDLRNPGGQALVGVSGYADTRSAGDLAKARRRLGMAGSAVVGVVRITSPGDAAHVPTICPYSRVPARLARREATHGAGSHGPALVRQLPRVCCNGRRQRPRAPQGQYRHRPGAPGPFSSATAAWV